MSAGKTSPWYVEAFLAVGGWIAGLLAAIAIFALAVAMVGDFKSDGSDIVAAMIALLVGGGFVFTGASIGGPDKGDFIRHFAIAAVAAGLTAATCGVWYLLYKPFDGLIAEERVAIGGAGFATAALLAAASWFIARRLRDGIFTFLATLAVYGVAFVSMSTLADRYTLAPDHILPPLCAFLGVFLFLEKRADVFLQPVGAALMIAPMAHFGLIENVRFLFETKALATGVVLFSKTAFLAAAFYCLSFLRGRYALAPLVATAVLIVSAVWLLPNAGGVAVVILLAGVAANHRGLAVAGVIAAAWFIGQFYYDLSMTLLAKSAVLAGMGAATLAGALAFRRLAKGGGEAGTAGARRGHAAILGFGVLLAFSLALVNRSVFDLETAFREGENVYFALGPRDPRSLIQGDYMVLNYRDDIYPPRETADALPASGEVFLRVDEARVAVFSRIAGAGDVPAADEIRIDYLKSRDGRIRYVPESFFFQEGEAQLFEPARFAIVRVAPDGRARLEGLADETFKPLGE